MKTTASTVPETDGAAAYRLGNLALILLWAAGMAIVGYSIASDASWDVRISMLAALAIPLLARNAYFIIRLLRKKPPRSDAAMIAEGGPWQDERQNRLQDKAGFLAGAVAMAIPVLLAIFGAEFASQAGVTITDDGDWLALGLGISNAALVTHTIAFIIAARHYSRKG
jgi:hypothetical protein